MMISALLLFTGGITFALIDSLSTSSAQPRRRRAINEFARRTAV